MEEIKKAIEDYTYDETILKRRKKKLQGNGVSVSVPKKGLTAYAIFVKTVSRWPQKRRELMKDEEFAKNPDMMKELGQMWSNLSKPQWAIYEEFAKRDKLRYQREMKDFLANGGNEAKLNEVEQWRPKKCLSAYMIFVRETRCVIQQNNPDMPVLQIMKEVGWLWWALTPPERKRFQDKADVDKIWYKKELKEFEKEVDKLDLRKGKKNDWKPRKKDGVQGKRKRNDNCVV